MRNFFFFDSMMTPKVITLIYWLSLLFVFIEGIGTMMNSYGGASLASFLMGLGIIIGGSFLARVWCEILIVLFKINDNIRKISDRN